MGFLYDFGDGWVVNLMQLEYFSPYEDENAKDGKKYKLEFSFSGRGCFTSSFKTKEAREKCIDEILAFVPTIKIQHDYSAGCIVPNGTVLSTDTLPKEDVRADAYSLPAVQSLFNK
jgi:hypothetical protein